LSTERRRYRILEFRLVVSSLMHAQQAETKMTLRSGCCCLLRAAASERLPLSLPAGPSAASAWYVVVVVR